MISVARGVALIRDRGRAGPVAVLASGGVDSAALLVHLAKGHDRVYPIFVRCGLRWEDAEAAGLRSFLEAVNEPRIAAITLLDEPVADVYGSEHWSVDGPLVPGLDSPDEAVFLPGRNLLLVTKAAVWCRVRSISLLALGSLAGNPFPDSSDSFFEELAQVINRGMVGDLSIIRPFAGLKKVDVLNQSPSLPWHLTFSCLNPDDRGWHCGACNKCSERIRAFQAARIADATEYVSSQTLPT